MKRNVLFTVISALAIASAAFATDSSDLTVTVAAEASFVSVGNAPLTHSGNNFAAFTGTTTYSYKLRTAQSGGVGHVSLQVSTFGGAGAPLVADLKYSCADGASGASPCTGAANQPDASAATSVATFGPDFHSADAGNSASVGWTLVDQPATVTGNYTSTATFTISAIS